ncbi:MAG: hypothetical protein ACM3QY_02820 [Candidatus Levyibacteriota bacterium]
MTATGAAGDLALGPWNPGIRSEVPDALRDQCTILRPENVYTGIAKARELRDLTGLDFDDVVAFRPQRLALHELLIRVTADLSVPDGSRIEDLGINFRRMTGRILARHVEPRMDEVASIHADARSDLAAMIDREFGRTLPLPGASAGAAAHSPPRTRFWRLFPPRRPAAAPAQADDEAQARLLAEWRSGAREAATARDRAAYRALAKVVSAVVIRHGRIWGSRELLVSLAVDLACNEFASDGIGRLIDSCVADAARTEGYMLLPRQERPVVMNTKGPSASGKSTLRPLQKKLAGDIGVNWAEFALISPDIWRKQLIDYGRLGAAFRYGGAFSGEELQIIDQKLDRYMARKAESGAMPHLLIDRFRFDSFAPDSNEAGSNLLTRFGQLVYLFFMIAPPEMLVERAWKRGLDVGRYKAVDDTLAHAVEAYSGMPDLFFTWVERDDKDVHFEFLDNSVAVGERPRTVAFGRNRRMAVLDVRSLLDVERFCRIDVDARAPERLYPDRTLLAPEKNAGFLSRCVQRFAEVSFADQASGRVYLRVVRGRPVWADRAGLARALEDPDTRAGLQVTIPGWADGSVPDAAQPRFLRDDDELRHLRTLGSWGDRTGA